MQGVLINLVGQKYGKLTVLERIKKEGGVGIWRCRCDCGNFKNVSTSHLTQGRVTSCSCVVYKHRLSKTVEYKTHQSILARCKTDPYYGGRGIKVCDRWSAVAPEGFLNFLEDMGKRPDKNYSIERLDVDGDYSPENCVWIENKFQAKNKRIMKNNASGVRGVFEGNGKCVATWVTLDKVRKSKSFTISKYGYELAFFLACEYREQMINLLNLQGAGYKYKIS